MGTMFRLNQCLHRSKAIALILGAFCLQSAIASNDEKTEPATNSAPAASGSPKRRDPTELRPDFGSEVDKIRARDKKERDIRTEQESFTCSGKCTMTFGPNKNVPQHYRIQDKTFYYSAKKLPENSGAWKDYSFFAMPYASHSITATDNNTNISIDATYSRRYNTGTHYLTSRGRTLYGHLKDYYGGEPFYNQMRTADGRHPSWRHIKYIKK